MKRAEEITVTSRVVAGEPALRALDSAATVLFGIGPRFEERSSRTQRLASILEDLSPDLRAVRWARQVHGHDVMPTAGEGPEAVRCVGDADGLLTSSPGVGLVVWTADCVPVALVGPRAVAMVHAGWRGAAAGIAARAVRQLADAGCPPPEVRAYLGPAVSSDHYQVGPEVIEALVRTGVPDASWRGDDRVDLRRFLAAQLDGLGVGRVTTVGGCTFATTELASYRRDGHDAGRQWSMVWRMAESGSRVVDSG